MTPEEKIAWLDARKRGVSGTDVAALMGLNPYKKEADVLMDKLGRGKEFVGNAATRAGNKLEPIVADLYSSRFQRILTPGEFLRHPENDRHLGTPDFLHPFGGLEIKTGAEKTFKNGCPTYYETQSRWYMYLTDRDEWDLYGLIVPKDRSEIPEYSYEWVSLQPVREFRFQRDQAFERRMLDAADRFLEKWDRIQRGEVSGVLGSQLPWR